jgi:hypothetical protein
VHDGYPVVFIAAPGDEMMMINHVSEVTCGGAGPSPSQLGTLRFAPTSTTISSFPKRTATCGRSWRRCQHSLWPTI